MKDLLKTLSVLRQRGVEIWAEGAELHYRTTSTPLTAEEVEYLRTHKGLLVALLGKSADDAANASSIPFVDRSRPLPSSFAQQQLWFLAQTPNGSQAYHISMGFRLEGVLDIDSLARAFARLAERHEALRTRFEVVAGEAFQRVDRPEERMHLKWDDLSEGSDSQARLAGVMTEEALAAFDLEQGPLMRVRLVRIATQEHVLLITVHHIICDGWSMPLMTKELGELYRTIAKGEHDPTSLLGIQYADYAAWQRQWLGDGAAAALRGYWREELAKAPALLELPTDRPRPRVQQFKSGIVAVELDEKMTIELNNVARRHRMTLFMVILSAWAIVLSRLSGQSAVVIGSPVANRTRPELEGLVGLFVNTLAHHIDLSGAPTLEDMLLRTREKALAAQEHQELPLDQVVELVNPSRSTAYPPLFQVLLAWQNNESVPLRFPDLRVTQIKSPPAAAKFDLTLEVSEVNGRVAGELIYAASLFEAETIRRHGGYLHRVLSEMATNPGKLVSEIDLLSPREWQQVVALFNATEASFPHEKLIHELFEEQVERSPTAQAVAYESQSLTYAELNARANQLAWYLREKGVGPEQRVGICVERSLEMVVGLLGILKAGGAYVPMDPNYPPERLRYMMVDASPCVMITQQHLKECLPEIPAKIVTLDLLWNAIAQYPSENLNRSIVGLSTSNLAYVIYTSGSTGRPKGAMNEHVGVVNRLQWMQAQYRMDAEDRVLQKTPFSFDVSVWEFFWTLMSGAELILVRPEGHKDPEYLRKLIDETGVTRLHFVPSMLQIFLDQLQFGECVSVRHIVCSGEELPASLQEKCYACMPHVCLSNLYGPTEAAVDVTAWECRLEDRGLRVPIGHPIANIQIYLLTRYGLPVPIGVAGELYIGGIGVGRGYLNQPGLTAERFVADPFSGGPRARLYKTGDLGRWRSDGTIEYLGRGDQQVKIRGFRIELGEIEARLNQHEIVKEAVVLVREDHPGERHLVAYVVPREDGGAEQALYAEVLRGHLKSALPEYMVPCACVILARLPLTPNGKLDRKALPPPELGAYMSRQCEAPRGEVEEILAEFWQGLLRVERVGRESNFFEMGGHSLLAMKLLMKIVERFRIQFSVSLIFQHPALCDMGCAVEEQILGGKGIVSPRELELEDSEQ